MLRLLAVTVCAAGLGLLAAPEPELFAMPDTRCVPPSFRGEYYRPHTLRTASVRVGERVGTARIVRLRGTRCVAETRLVHRLRAVPIGRAVSVGGSSRELLVRIGVCEAPRSDLGLVRCLKR